MRTVSIQVRETNLDWEKTPKSFQTFSSWQEITSFAYRLALIAQREVRIENKGNGHYYHPSQALNYLNASEIMEACDKAIREPHGIEANSIRYIAEVSPNEIKERFRAVLGQGKLTILLNALNIEL